MKIPKITEKEIAIIKNAQAGNILAFNRIFYMYKEFVDNLLFKYIKDRDEAKDLTNIVFLKIYNKLSKFSDYNSFGGWIRILAKNTAIDYLRTIKDNNMSLDKITSAQMCLSDNDESSTINKLTYDYFIEQLNHLSPLYRNICTLFYKDNLTVKQISDLLNIPTGTVKSYLHRTRKRLQKQLKNEQLYLSYSGYNSCFDVISL